MVLRQLKYYKKTLATGVTREGIFQDRICRIQCRWTCFWKSKLQTIVTESARDAEYVAASYSARHIYVKSSWVNSTLCSTCASHKSL